MQQYPPPQDARSSWQQGPQAAQPDWYRGPSPQVVQPGWQEGPYDMGIKQNPHGNVAQLYQEEEDRRISVTTAKGRPKPNYRPVSLRWWYIGSLVAVVIGLAAVVVYSNFKLRGSDSSATIESRSLGHDEAWIMYRRGLEKLQARQDGAPATPVPAPATEEPQPTDSPEPPSEGGTGDAPPPETGIITSALVEVTMSIPMTGPPIVETITTGIETTVTQEGSLSTESIPAVVVTYTTTREGGAPPEETGAVSGGDGGPPAPTSAVVEYYYSTISEASEITHTVPGGVVTTTTPVTTAITKPGSVYFELGRTTILSTFTVNRDGKKIEAPSTRLLTSDLPGSIVQSVETLQPTEIVITGPDGILTTVMSTPPPITHTSSVPPTRRVITSLSTPTSSGDMVIVQKIGFEVNSTKYFIGKFLPLLLAVILVLALRAVDQTAKLYQPFASLSHPHGATGRDSLSLHFDGWGGFWRPFGMLSKGHPVPFLSTMAVWLSSTLAPLASEAIGLKIHGHCKINEITGCALSLGVSSLEAYILIGVLVVIALLLTTLLVAVSRHWKTGVFADPWCVAGAAALVRNPDVRSIGAPDFKAVKAAIAEKQFSLGWFRNQDGREEYGLVLCDESGRSLRGARREEEGSAMMVEAAYAEGMGYRGDGHVHTVRKPPATFIALTFWWRLVFLIYLILLMGFVIYYHLGFKVPNNFKKFMEEEKFGVRFISSALGMVVTLCWDCIYCSVAIIAPYRRMANGPQGPSRSVLARRPTYAVTGIYTGVRERDPLLFGVASMVVLSAFLPMLLANVPYDLTQTRDVRIICARVSAGLLFLMVVALVTSMFVRWPELPVDPRSVAGEMWYVAEARWVDKLEGVAVMSDSERKARFRDMGGKWYYGLLGTRLGERMGVEMHDVYGMMEYSGYR